MAEFTLPKNSKITKGRTFKAEGSGKSDGQRGGASRNQRKLVTVLNELESARQHKHRDTQIERKCRGRRAAQTGHEAGDDSRT